MATFYFAWVSAGSTSFQHSYARNDEEVVSVEITHSEGELASLAIVLRNPRVGLLHPSRNVWAWLSYETESDSGGPTPLFFGRLIAVPDELQDDAVTLTFLARPADYEDRKLIVAEALKVPPYYDPVWLTEEQRASSDGVLEGRPVAWHIDRVTHEVTVSSILAGEDGTIAFDPDSEILYDSVSISHGPPPVRTVRVDASVFWTQAAVGDVDLTLNICAAFADAGTTSSAMVSSFTYQGLEEDWPKDGDDIGGPWTVKTSFVERGMGKWVNDPETIEIPFFDDFSLIVAAEDTVTGFFALGTLKPTFIVQYEVERTFTERVTFDLVADTQAVVSDAGDDEIIALTLSSADIAEPIDSDGSAGSGDTPMGDVRWRSYIKTDRGLRSVENLIARARAVALARSRAVKIEFDIPFDSGLSLSCRKSATVADPRIPGETATGKITSYSLIADGDTGERICRVVMECCVGAGNTVFASNGNPTYAADGYVADGYVMREGRSIEIVAGEVTYNDYRFIEPNDDGLDLFRMTPERSIARLQVIDGETEQRAILTAERFADIPTAIEALNARFTEVDLEMQTFGEGPFETHFPVQVSRLMAPKGIDLTAGGSS